MTPTGLARSQQITIAVAALFTLAAGAGHYADFPALVVFGLAAVALAGLASLVSLGTESIGARLSTGATGVMQSTLGNLPEFFVVLFALKAGETVVAQTSILGSLFANAFLVLGLVLIAGCRASKDGVMRFHPRLPNDTTTLLMVAVFIIVLLGISVSAGDHASTHAQAISVGGALVLLVLYGIWLRGYLRDGEGAAHEEAPALALLPALVLLALAGVGAAFVSEWFVAALDPAVKALGISKAFAGLVIVAIAGNAVENVVGIKLAWQGQSDLAISVVKNSVAQIAVFLFPALVLVSLFFAVPLTFALAPVWIGALLLLVLALWQITGDGRATPFEGWALVALYLILALVAFYE